ncbi:MAG: helix-turn-helix domain-containing protein [Pseudomonadota bacterium]
MAQIQALDHSLPTEVDMQVADTLRKVLASQLERGEGAGATVQFTSEEGHPGEVVLSPQLARKFLDILRLISSGKGFHVVPFTAELTTQQAADMLNVSRPFLIGLLDKKAIPHHMAGRHRRIRAEDLFSYIQEREQSCDSALTDLIKTDFDEGLI